MNTHPSLDSPEYETHRETCDTCYGKELAEIAEREQAMNQNEQPSAERVRTLIALTNSVSALTQVVDLLSARLPDEIRMSEDWLRFTRDLPSRALEMCIPVYQKHVRADDLEALIEFYETPSGQRWIATLPTITAECSAFAPQLAAELLSGASDDGDPTP